MFETAWEKKIRQGGPKESGKKKRQIERCS